MLEGEINFNWEFENTDRKAIVWKHNKLWWHMMITLFKLELVNWIFNLIIYRFGDKIKWDLQYSITEWQWVDYSFKFHSYLPLFSHINSNLNGLHLEWDPPNLCIKNKWMNESALQHSTTDPPGAAVPGRGWPDVPRPLVHWSPSHWAALGPARRTGRTGSSPSTEPHSLEERTCICFCAAGTVSAINWLVLSTPLLIIMIAKP